MQRRIPLTITLVLGIIMMIQFFIPHKLSQDFFDLTYRWFIAIASFAVVLSLGSLINHHWIKIKRRREDWYFSIVTLVSLAVMIVLGIWRAEKIFMIPYYGKFLGVPPGTKIPLFNMFYLFIQVPLGATMFSMLAFYLASAAYRAFRTKTLESTLLLIAAFIVMGSVVLFNWEILGDFTEWLLSVPNLAAKRGIALGAALGGIATSLKIILGIERGYLGAGGGR